MSRTYRLRRLPRPPGSPLKYGDGQYNRRDPHYRSWQWFNAGLSWTLQKHAQEAAQQEDPAPIGAMWDHPLVGYGVVRSKTKKWYRITGNRRVRRPLKNLVNRWAHQGDDFEDRMPVRNDGWSTWDLW